MNVPLNPKLGAKTQKTHFAKEIANSHSKSDLEAPFNVHYSPNGSYSESQNKKIENKGQPYKAFSADKQLRYIFSSVRHNFDVSYYLLNILDDIRE